jgi:uncharacterized caspase-like protein
MKNTLAFRDVFFSCVAISLILLSSSCASVIHGTKQRVNVYSDPPGGQIYVNGQDTRKVTPAVVSVKRNSRTHYIKVNHPGYEEQMHELNGRFNFLVLADFFFFMFPAVVDVATGAHRLYDKSVYMQLSPRRETLPSPAIVSQQPLETGFKFMQRSDVDVNVPEHGKTFSNRYALIIGNEDYTTFQRDLTAESNVAYARNDASAFKAYAEKTLGIPERNITFLLDATSGAMRQGITKMNLIAKNTNGGAEFFIFYAGHGLPDEASKESYLIPVDVSGKYINLGIPLRELYGSLTEHPTQRVTVFLDACFSGGARNQALYASRGVRITPKDETVKGNMIVFAASAGDESALPYADKDHGIFTYHLLRKLQESEGRIKYAAMAQYLEKHIALESVLINNKEQHPKTILSPEIINTWQTWEFQ